VAKKTLKINTKTKRAHNLRGATSTASGHSRAILLVEKEREAAMGF